MLMHAAGCHADVLAACLYDKCIFHCNVVAFCPSIIHLCFVYSSFFELRVEILSFVISVFILNEQIINN